MQLKQRLSINTEEEKSSAAKQIKRREKVNQDYLEQRWKMLKSFAEIENAA